MTRDDEIAVRGECLDLAVKMTGGLGRDASEVIDAARLMLAFVTEHTRPAAAPSAIPVVDANDDIIDTFNFADAAFDDAGDALWPERAVAPADFCIRALAKVAGSVRDSEPQGPETLDVWLYDADVGGMTKRRMRRGEDNSFRFTDSGAKSVKLGVSPVVEAQA